MLEAETANSEACETANKSFGALRYGHATQHYRVGAESNISRGAFRQRFFGFLPCFWNDSRSGEVSARSFPNLGVRAIE